MNALVTHATIHRVAAVEGRLARAIRDIVVLAILNRETLYSREVAEEYTRITGERVTMTSISANMRRLRRNGLLVVKHGYHDAPPNALCCTTTSRGDHILAIFRDAMAPML